jgi:glutaminyl-tRNA synthetase
MMSKRNLLTLVQDKHVDGWDDPRMPTLSGMRRRGYPAAAIRAFCEAVGVAKADSTVDFAWLEHFVRDDLNKTAPRFMAVVNPLKVVIDNYPEGQTEELEAVNNPEDPEAGSRVVPFSKVLYIEREDFMENPPKQFFRLAPGREVRLRYAFFITCTDVVKDPATGEITELRCTYDPATRGGDAPDGRKVKSTLHWVSGEHAKAAEVRNYNLLFTKENPNRGKKGAHWTTNINPDSLEVVTDCLVEPALAKVRAGERVQFERLGYYCADSKEHTHHAPVFNRTVTLKDAWAKEQQKGA